MRPARNRTRAKLARSSSESHDYFAGVLRASQERQPGVFPARVSPRHHALLLVGRGQVRSR